MKNKVALTQLKHVKIRVSRFSIDRVAIKEVSRIFFWSVKLRSNGYQRHLFDWSIINQTSVFFGLHFGLVILNSWWHITYSNKVTLSWNVPIKPNMNNYILVILLHLFLAFTLLIKVVKIGILHRIVRGR